MIAIEKGNDAMANALLARNANVDLQDMVSQDSVECGYGVVVGDGVNGWEYEGNDRYACW